MKHLAINEAVTLPPMMVCHGMTDHFKTCLNEHFDFWFENKLRTQCFGNVFPRHVIRGRTEASCSNDNIRVRPSLEKGTFDLLCLVCNHATAVDRQTISSELRP